MTKRYASPSAVPNPGQRPKFKTRLKVRKDITTSGPVRTTYDPTIRLTVEEQRRLSSYGTLRPPTTSTTHRTWEQPQGRKHPVA